MRIALISDWEAAGGANIAALRLTEGFASAGNEVVRIYQRATNDGHAWRTHLIGATSANGGRLRSLATRLIPVKLARASHQRRSEGQLAELLRHVRPDIVNVHNLHIAGWSPAMIRVASHFAPTVCTLHDTWTLTGRCYNPGPCQKYLTGCDHECPTASEYPALEPRQIRRAWDLRRQILAETRNLAAVSPSRWLSRLATAGLWRPRKVYEIPYGLDLTCYQPLDRTLARRLLGLDDGAPVLLVCAAELANRKKGLHLLLEALSRGIGRSIHLVLMGTPVSVSAMPDVRVHQLGYISNDRLKAIVYSAADLFVHPSLADNAPLTVAESLACGTPVVAFAIDGVPETVVPKTTGWLAAGVSGELLQRAVIAAFDDLDRGLDYRSECRRFAVGQFDLPSVVRRYEQVFREVVHLG